MKGLKKCAVRIIKIGSLIIPGSPLGWVWAGYRLIGNEKAEISRRLSPGGDTKPERSRNVSLKERKLLSA